MQRGLALLCVLLVAGPASLVHGQAATLGPPRAARLGTPVAAPPAVPQMGQPVARGAAPEPDVLLGDMPRVRQTTPAATLGPIPGIRPVSGISLSASEPMSAEERYNWGTPDDPFQRRPLPDNRNESRTGGMFGNWGGGGDPMGGGGPRSWFGSGLQSDHDLDNFISPVTNPFLAEDPRKLTELRPIFMYQTIPHSNVLYRGGNIENFVMQGRLGLTERWSIVVNKLGVTSINRGSDGFLNSATGFDEIWLGPKWTFYKNCEYGTVAAAGLTFQIPVGSNNVYQGTGTLGLVPYVTAAQKFWKTSFGQFTVLDTLGYQFGTNNSRSDFFYNTIHFDYDVANYGRIFPLVELNWFHYTSNGTARPFYGFEAGDLGNVGAAVSGRDYLNIAIGARFKLSEAWQFGLATEFPLVGTRDLNNFRLTVDMIWRY